MCLGRMWVGDHRNQQIFFSFFVLGPHLRHLEVSRLRGQIKAAAVGLHPSHSHAGSELHL